MENREIKVNVNSKYNLTKYARWSPQSRLQFRHNLHIGPIQHPEIIWQNNFFQVVLFASSTSIVQIGKEDKKGAEYHYDGRENELPINH